MTVGVREPRGVGAGPCPPWRKKMTGSLMTQCSGRKSRRRCAQCLPAAKREQHAEEVQEKEQMGFGTVGNAVSLLWIAARTPQLVPTLAAPGWAGENGFPAALWPRRRRRQLPAAVPGRELHALVEVGNMTRPPRVRRALHLLLLHGRLPPGGRGLALGFLQARPLRSSQGGHPRGCGRPAAPPPPAGSLGLSRESQYAAMPPLWRGRSSGRPRQLWRGGSGIGPPRSAPRNITQMGRPRRRRRLVSGWVWHAVEPGSLKR